MSEVFDPEKIDRWDCEASGNVVEASDGQYIRAADYDKLLALYRELVPLPPDPSTLPTIAEMRGLLNP